MSAKKKTVAKAKKPAAKVKAKAAPKKGGKKGIIRG